MLMTKAQKMTIHNQLKRKPQLKPRYTAGFKIKKLGLGFTSNQLSQSLIKGFIIHLKNVLNYLFSCS